tara:strand:+ start:10524 stop:10979 length:456 start_codon:yes stop_codon:yes gene_type:complete
MIAKISIILLLFLSCTVSPRYGVQSNDSTKKTKKNIKYSKKNKKSSELIGVSSWYGPNFHGKLTANGEVYDMYGVTAAHKTLTLGTVVRVTNLDNGKSLILRINDRGPYVDGRILDCSFGAAKKLGFHEQGTANVEIKIIEEGDGVYMHHN